MNAISVGYRFSREELSTLLQALRIGALPGAPLNPVDQDTAERILQRLTDEGMAVFADGTLYVDKLIGYLLRATAGAASAAALTDGSRTAVLWVTDQMFVLGDFPASGECSLTPLQDAEAALSALTDMVCRLPRPLWGVSVFDTDRSVDVPENSLQSGRDIALSIMQLLDIEVDGSAQD